MSNKPKLSDDEVDVLGDIFVHDGIRPLLKILKWMAEEQVKQLGTYDIKSGSDRELALKKAEYDGAVKLYNNFTSYLQKKQI